MSRQFETDGSRYAAFWRDEIIVALPHLVQVETILCLARVEWTTLDTSAALGLARLELRDVGAAARDVRAYLQARKIAVPDPRPEDRAVDRLLGALRAYFLDRHAGWYPTMGKNRLVGAVNGGGGAISHGGGGTPVRVSGELPARGSGPGRGVRVGVLDTGLAAQPWLAGGWEAGYSDRLPRGKEYREGAGHATFITGLVLSQAPGATVVVRKVLDLDENGEYTADCWTVANAIVELGRTGIDVLNLSLVCYTEDGQPPLLLSTAVSRLGPDVVVVAAAGNHGDLHHRQPDKAGPGETSKPTFPAALDGVVAVGAATDEGEPASFTPLDKYWIDLLAPGEKVLSTYLDGDVLLDDKTAEPFGGLARWSGSSFAAALVSGAIAAGMQPGRVTARQALQDIRGAAVGDPTAELPDGYTPPFVPLDLPKTT
jgi:membrane-anchored mycosin MYCP